MVIEQARIRRNNANGELRRTHNHISEESEALRAQVADLAVRLQMCTNTAAEESRRLNERVEVLQAELETEQQRRHTAELCLNRVLYGNVDFALSVANSFQTVTNLLHCCENIPDVTVDEAVFGQTGDGNTSNASSSSSSKCLMNCLRSEICTESLVRAVMEAEATALERPSLQRLTVAGVVSTENLLAIRLYTCGGASFNVYSAINNPFYDSRRNVAMLSNQLPYVRLLTKSLVALGRATQFQRGVVYRGAKLEGSPYLQKVWV